MSRLWYLYLLSLLPRSAQAQASVSAGGWGGYISSFSRKADHRSGSSSTIGWGISDKNPYHILLIVLFLILLEPFASTRTWNSFGNLQMMSKEPSYLYRQLFISEFALIQASKPISKAYWGQTDWPIRLVIEATFRYFDF